MAAISPGRAGRITHCRFSTSTITSPGFRSKSRQFTHFARLACLQNRGTITLRAGTKKNGAPFDAPFLSGYVQPELLADDHAGAVVADDVRQRVVRRRGPALR